MTVDEEYKAGVKALTAERLEIINKLINDHSYTMAVGYLERSIRSSIIFLQLDITYELVRVLDGIEIVFQYIPQNGPNNKYHYPLKRCIIITGNSYKDEAVREQAINGTLLELKRDIQLYITNKYK